VCFIRSLHQPATQSAPRLPLLRRPAPPRSPWPGGAGRAGRPSARSARSPACPWRSFGRRLLRARGRRRDHLHV